MTNFDTELEIKQQYSNDNIIIAGIDEVGRGAWAGPVVTGAVIINKGKISESIKDSKQINPKKRKKISDFIWENHICAIGSASVEEINKLGINPAIFLAIERSLVKLSTKANFALIDGNYKHQFSIPSQNIIKGDSKSISIAAASIIAKHYRDELMQTLSIDLPMYHWQKNVGYGTKDHIENLHKHGVSKHHRLTYKPIRELLTQS